jgi:hypothetical protein
MRKIHRFLANASSGEIIGNHSGNISDGGRLRRAGPNRVVADFCDFRAFLRPGSEF